MFVCTFLYVINVFDIYFISLIPGIDEMKVISTRMWGHMGMIIRLLAVDVLAIYCYNILVQPTNAPEQQKHCLILELKFQ